MPSLIPGYEYDIFISYRQKDNKHDGWVTEFVDNLKGELESTFKEEISVYFDNNPHDGLLETHDVDASLKDKLKCLIFIPIISRTYCDPKSFAWEHEFIAFVEEASQDQFGLKIKLPNGNVANRVLPVRIHDLDNNDIKLCESILGGVLRGIEFIYKEPGVDKPLASEDNEKKNLNNTKYRIQIIKVAHAIKDIILGLKAESVVPLKESVSQKELNTEVYKEDKQKDKDKPVKLNKRKLLSGVLITAILVIAAILAYQKIFKRDTLEKLRSSGKRISVAVMPFQNMTNDTIWNVWQNGIQDNLITSFSNSEELLVRQRAFVTSLLQSKGLTNYASITPPVASTISRKLGADIFIHGSINQVGSTIRLNAQIVESKTEEVFKSFQQEGSADKILFVIDSLSSQIRDFLILSHFKQKEGPEARNYEYTTSPKAYINYISGCDAFNKSENMVTARECFSEAIKCDSNFTLARIWLSVVDLNLRKYEEGKKCIMVVYEKRDQMSTYMRNKVDDIHAWYTEGPQGRIKYLKQMIDIDDQDPNPHGSLGNSYRLLGQYDKAIPEFEKFLDILKIWGIKPPVTYYTAYLSESYHKIGDYKKERKLYKDGEKLFPENPGIKYRQAILSLTEEDTIEANRFIEKYKSICKENSLSEVEIVYGVASIYYLADKFDKAEKYFRQALSLEPDKPDRLNNLGWLLIETNQNINEGLLLLDKALALKPDNYEFMETKGWGLYKVGKYKEALEILQKSWDLRMKNAIYNHPAYLHLEEAKKAAANQK